MKEIKERVGGGGEGGDIIQLINFHLTIILT
jgi:hypothetical protein